MKKTIVQSKNTKLHLEMNTNDRHLILRNEVTL